MRGQHEHVELRVAGAIWSWASRRARARASRDRLTLERRPQLAVADQEQLDGRLQHAHRREQVVEPLALDQPPRVADRERAPAVPRAAASAPSRGPPGSESDLARAPQARASCAALSERAATNAARAAPASAAGVRARAGAYRCSRSTAPRTARRAVRRLGSTAWPRARTARPRGTPRPGASRATARAAGQVQVALRAPGKEHGRRAQGSLQARERAGAHRLERVLAAPAIRQDDRQPPASPRQLPVDLLVDVDHRRMADHQKTPSACAAIDREGAARVCPCGPTAVARVRSRMRCRRRAGAGCPGPEARSSRRHPRTRSHGRGRLGRGQNPRSRPH